VMALLIRFFNNRIRATFLGARQALSEATGYLQECLSGMKTLQLFAAERQAIDAFKAKNRKFLQAQNSSNYYDALMFSLVEGVTTLALALLLWYSAGELLAGVLTLGVLVAFMEYIQRLFVPVREFSQQVATIQRANLEIERDLTNKQKTETATVAAQLEQALKQVEVARETVASDTNVRVANIMADGNKRSAEIDAQLDLLRLQRRHRAGAIADDRRTVLRRLHDDVFAHGLIDIGRGVVRGFREGDQARVPGRRVDQVAQGFGRNLATHDLEDFLVSHQCFQAIALIAAGEENSYGFG